jgi:hypothetical protein
MDTRYKFYIEGVVYDECSLLLKTIDFKVKSTTRINRVLYHLMQNLDANKKYRLEIHKKNGKVWRFYKNIVITDIDDYARFRNYNLVSSSNTLKFVLKPIN